MTNNQQAKLISLAKSLIGKPYKYGARTEEAPEVFDCSLFTQYVFKQIGIEISRSTIEQATEGEKVNGLENLEIGDLIFLHGTRGHYNPHFPEGIGHAAIYIGNGMAIHAGSRRIEENPKIIEVGKVEEIKLDTLIERAKPVIIVRRF